MKMGCLFPFICIFLMSSNNTGLALLLLNMFLIFYCFDTVINGIISKFLGQIVYYKYIDMQLICVYLSCVLHIF